MLIRNSPGLKTIYTIEKADYLEKRYQGYGRYERFIYLYSKKEGDNYFPLGARRYVNIPLCFSFDKIEIHYKGTLREAQLEAISHILYYDGGLIEASTSAGKTHIIMGVIDRYKRKTLVVTPRIELVNQMFDEIKEYMNYEPGVYGGKKKDIKDITITTSASFTEKFDLFCGKFDIIIFDECEDQLSSSMISCICLSDANVLVGLSGTPFRNDITVKGLEKIYGNYIKVGDFQRYPDTINQIIYSWNQSEIEEYMDYTNWHTMREGMINNKEREKFIFDYINDEIKKYYLPLLLVDRIEYAEYIYNYMKNTYIGKNICIITGNTTSKEYKEKIKQIKETGGIIVGTIDKLYRGTNIVEIDCVMIVSPLKFKGRVIQSIGRGLRDHPSKGNIGIYKFEDDILYGQLKHNNLVLQKEYKMNVNKIFINKD